MFPALLAAGAQGATVTLNGGAGCLSVAGIQVELDDVDGLLGSDRVLVDLVQRTEPWTVYVRVVRREVEVWKRSLDVAPEDCPLLAAAVARAIERGLDGVPRWPFARDRRRWFLGFRTSASWPYLEGNAAITLGRGPRGRGTWSWTMDAGAFTRAVQPVGQGRISISGAVVGLGPVAQKWFGATGIGLSPRVEVGYGRGVAFGFPDEDPPFVRPRVSGSLDGFARLPRGFEFGLRATYVAVRSSFVSREPGWSVTAPEPRWRLGFFVGIRGAVGE